MNYKGKHVTWELWSIKHYKKNLKACSEGHLYTPRIRHSEFHSEDLDRAESFGDRNSGETSGGSGRLKPLKKLRGLSQHWIKLRQGYHFRSLVSVCFRGNTRSSVTWCFFTPCGHNSEGRPITTLNLEVQTLGGLCPFEHSLRDPQPSQIWPIFNKCFVP